MRVLLRSRYASTSATASAPCGQGALADRRGRERLRGARAEDETAVAPRDKLVLNEEMAERRDDRHTAAACAALGAVRFPVAAHAAVDADQTVCEVDIVPGQGPELAAPQACVERAAPQRPIFAAKRGDECGGLGR